MGHRRIEGNSYRKYEEDMANIEVVVAAVEEATGPDYCGDEAAADPDPDHPPPKK